MWYFFRDYWIYMLSGVILIPGLVVSIWAQVRVNSTFMKYNAVQSAKNITGYDITRKMLDDAALYNTKIVKTGGHLTDHYDPATQTIALSADVHDSASLAALGVAAHEAGHALQYKTGYFPIKLRSALVPILNVSSSLMWPLLFVGIFLSAFSYNSLIGNVLILVGASVFGLSVLFQLVTLPVEYNASRRAYSNLISTNALSREEAKGARKVLNAAALTYVAALLTSILTLFRFLFLILLSRNRSRR